MAADDLTRIAERYTELMHPGGWPRMSDAQNAVSLHIGKALGALGSISGAQVASQVLVD